MRAEGPRQAVKWVTTIHRRKRVDALRAIRTDPVQQGLRDSSRHPDAPSPLERLTDDAPPILSSAAIEAVLTATLEQVHLALEETVRSAAKRALRRTQAQAALLRIVCEWDAEAIVAALDYGEPIQRDRLYKWVERGRQPVLAGLERWERTADAETWDSVGVVVETLRELMQERRADAGVPRRARRGASPKEVS